VSSGPLTEYRNVVMFNLTTAHKKAHPENWKQALEESNIRYCPTPLEAKEIVGIERQQEKKEYGYQCKATPLCNFCDKALCKTPEARHRFGSPGRVPKGWWNVCADGQPSAVLFGHRGQADRGHERAAAEPAIV
jgi:hypothetical protein